MTWKHIFLVVSGCAIAGMIMGGLFGMAAGKLAPGFFSRLVPWQEEVEPVGLAAFLGATAGVLLGGGLGCFGVIVQMILQWRRRDRPA